MRRSTIVVTFVAFIFLSFFPKSSYAIPSFARKYSVKCSTCHLIPPVLNKTGYMFKRLGYRMPGEAANIADLDKGVPFTIPSQLALVNQGSFTVDGKHEGDNSTTTSSFNLDKVGLFTGGAIPAQFSYFVEFNLSEGGETGLEVANFGYTGGTSERSFFVKAGTFHAQEGDGVRAAASYSVFPEHPPILTHTDPLNFTLDINPVGVELGYTFAPASSHQIVGLSAKVENGVAADGTEILVNSPRNSKDVWLDVDWWFAPEGGVTVMTYQGHKDQLQNEGTPDEFTFTSAVRRYGVFANYLAFGSLDLQAGYMRGVDDWQDVADGPLSHYTADNYRGEADYYPQSVDGLVLFARYDRINERIADGPTAHTNDWGAGVEKTLTEMGNVILRASYRHRNLMDPLAGPVARHNVFKTDLRVMW